ncbi:unnamed protein product [Boreogadus saida]
MSNGREDHMVGDEGKDGKTNLRVDYLPQSMMGLEGRDGFLMSPGPGKDNHGHHGRTTMGSSLQFTAIWTTWQVPLPMQILQDEPERGQGPSQGADCHSSRTHFGNRRDNKKNRGKSQITSFRSWPYRCFNIFNHDSWPESQEKLVDHGADDLEFLLKHFSPIITRNGVNTELAKEEFVAFKILISRMFKDKPVGDDVEQRAILLSVQGLESAP